MGNLPTINPRFIFLSKFKSSRAPFAVTITPILNADGHLDYAHQCGLQSTETELLDQRVISEDDGSSTRWCTVKVKVVMKNGTFAEGIACVSSRDKFVKQPGYEVAVAETRAMKRAIATVCNITEAVINPDGQKPTRDFVDMPAIKEDEEETDIPADIKRFSSMIIDADAANFDV